jgi:hypothetical protein
MSFWIISNACHPSRPVLTSGQRHTGHDIGRCDIADNDVRPRFFDQRSQFRYGSREMPWSVVVEGRHGHVIGNVETDIISQDAQRGLYALSVDVL